MRSKNLDLTYLIFGKFILFIPPKIKLIGNPIDMKIVSNEIFKEYIN